MARSTRVMFAAGVALAVAAGPAVTAADDGGHDPSADTDDQPRQAEPAPEAEATDSTGSDIADHRFELAVGLRGGLGGAGGTGFDDDASVTDQEGTEIPSSGDTWPRPEYYPHFGLGAGIGPTVEVRYNERVGLETGLIYSRDNADGYVDKEEDGTVLARINSEQRTSALHIPLMAKLTSRSETVRPFVGGGVQFVVQTSSQLDYHQEERAGRYRSEDIEELNERNQIEPSSYVQTIGSVGAEFVAGDVRFPVELRTAFTVGQGTTMESRARGEDGQIIYDGVYRGHFSLYAGALYEFDLVP